MLENPVIQSLLKRKSIRVYTKELPTDEVIYTIVRAGQQAPFASQLGSLLLSRNSQENTFKAPLQFIVCVDVHRWELIMAQRGWSMVADDLLLLVLGMQDAALMAENMVTAAESLGLGSCFLGGIPFQSSRIIKKYGLPTRVFPMVGLTMGYPAEDPPPRPRFPMEFVLFEGRYPDFSSELIQRAMDEMDEGYLAQDYYRIRNAMIPLVGDREEKFTLETYSWTEHISRKWGQRIFPHTLIQQFEKCGFNIRSKETREEKIDT